MINFCDFPAVIFDLDGTLVDSMGMWAEIDIEYLARYGITPPEHLQREIEGFRWSETAEYFKKRFHLRDSIEEIGADWLNMARDKYLHEVPLKNGVREYLSFLKKQECHIAIASSNYLNLIEDVLRGRGIRDYFDEITTCDDVSAGKPDPSVYLVTAEKMKVQPSDCLVFEDIPAGIMAGKNAGMTVIAVQDTYSQGMENEKRILADGFISDYRELLENT